MKQLHIAELFAGVGGFRLGLERASAGFKTVFSSQWEPPGTASKQFASRCYIRRFGADGHSNEDIAEVLSRIERGATKLPKIDVVVGGFPCQDYSVAKPLNQAEGLVGKKGILWWQIFRLLNLLKKAKRPAKWVFLENVDRLIKSPATQRGRDFAIMIASLSDLGYDVEWRVINAADYGFPQRRRRVFIVARLRRGKAQVDGREVLLRSGLFAKAFPIVPEFSPMLKEAPSFKLEGGLDEITRDFGKSALRSQFGSSGFASSRNVWTWNPKPLYRGPKQTLRDVIQTNVSVGPEFLVSPASIEKWKYVKGAKAERRVHKSSGFVYHYTEGALPFPDPVNRPSRTVLTSEGGASATRSKHVVALRNGSMRRLVPIELELLNGFPAGWTDTGMTDGQRAFCMGNALVVGIVELVAYQIALEAGLPVKRVGHKDRVAV
jgi:DNA (cytosine-5)-methyltransferase 1